MRRWAWFLAAAVLVAATLPARAGEILPAVIYAVGQKFDHSFNEGAYGAAESFKRETGIDYLEFQPQTVAEFERGVSALVRRGATDVVAIGYFYATPLERLAARFPAVRFTLIDAESPGANVRSVTYREQEGAYLVGLLAAMASKTHQLGFIGALDIPLIRRYITGFEQGAKAAEPPAQTLVNFVGTTPAAFNDPATGGEVARGLFERGVDVVFAGAGSSNFGIFQQAVDQHKLAIGVDSNQNGLHPGTILTSMLKRVDGAILASWREARAGTWQGGARSIGLAEQGLDYALDQNNQPLISPEMRARVEQARQEIIAGRILIK